MTLNGRNVTLAEINKKIPELKFVQNQIRAKYSGRKREQSGIVYV